MLKHGMFGTKIYASWSAMLSRCRNPKAQAYKNYGAVGVTVCARWYSFENFQSDMGPTHWDGAEIDRINPFGNYEPENCRWLTSSDNPRNRRYHTLVTYRGEVWKLPLLCLDLGVSRRHVNSRLAVGWELERALHTPVRSVELKMLEVAGRTLAYRQASREFGVSVSTINGRLLRGWSPEEAVGIAQRTPK